MYRFTPATGRINTSPEINSPEIIAGPKRTGGLKNTAATLTRDIFPFLAPGIRQVLSRLDPDLLLSAEEIRIRLGKPLLVRVGMRDLAITPDGVAVPGLAQGYLVSRDDLLKTVQLLSQCSVYALEEELRNGYITVQGGHRVGLVGRAVLDNGQVRSVKHIAGINFRLAKEIRGAADPVLPYLVQPPDRVFYVLIISPPRCGKTTMLRDIIRQLSNGIPALGFSGVNVGVVDERSEIAACLDGVPQNDVGIRTDVLDACPKTRGISMLIRGMSPQVIATDEIGSAEDALIIEEAARAGVSLITTAHGHTLEDLKQRPTLRSILNRRIFERFVILGRSRGVGTVESVLDGRTGKELRGQDTDSRVPGNSVLAAARKEVGR